MQEHLTSGAKFLAAKCVAVFATCLSILYPLIRPHCFKLIQYCFSQTMPLNRKPLELVKQKNLLILASARSKIKNTMTAITKGMKLPGKPTQKEIIRDEIFTRFDTILGLKWHNFNFVLLTLAHACGGYMIYRLLTFQSPWSVVFFFEIPYGYLGVTVSVSTGNGLGVTVGAHRYWSHKTFKAKLPLQVILMIFHTMGFQTPIYKWCLDHRMHHKYTDTDGDPHNSKRGFWFSHVTWALQPKREAYMEKFRTFDMPDLANDPVVRFQAKYFYTLSLIFFLLLPMCTLYSVWGLSLFHCLCFCMVRYIVSLHITWLVNSAAHKWGSKPFDKSLSATDSAIMAFFTVGEGWHNYHHAFPWDYKASELGWKCNLSTIFIDFCAWMGWVWDLKTVPPTMIKDRVLRTGDTSLLLNSAKLTNSTSHTTNADAQRQNTNENYWGWDDSEIPNDLRKFTRILSPGGNI